MYGPFIRQTTHSMMQRRFVHIGSPYLLMPEVVFSLLCYVPMGMQKLSLHFLDHVDLQPARHYPKWSKNEMSDSLSIFILL